ncbi:hypothetical protein FACS1894185_3430 [Betaproteobacteria bacterium]|nr:hypothetical protein FACS1894185_3430 [Betaproteobacteria bacterium]
MPKLSTNIKLIFSRQFTGLDLYPLGRAMLAALLNDGMGARPVSTCIVEGGEATLTTSSQHNLCAWNVVTVTGAEGEFTALNDEWRVKRILSENQLVIDAYGIPDGDAGTFTCALTPTPGWTLAKNTAAVQLWKNNATGLYVLKEAEFMHMGWKAAGNLLSLSQPLVKCLRITSYHNSITDIPTIAANEKGLIVCHEGASPEDQCYNDLFTTAPDAVCLLNNLTAATSVLTPYDNPYSVVVKKGTAMTGYYTSQIPPISPAMQGNTVLTPVIMTGRDANIPAWIAPHLLQVHGKNPLAPFEVIELDGIRYMHPWGEYESPQLLNITDWSDIPDAL